MKNFFSLSKFPGKTGETNYSKFFELKGLPHSYTAMGCDDLDTGMKQMIQLEANGFSVSMPYKSSIIDHLHTITPYVAEFNCCNTVIVENGKFIGYNTDYYGAVHIINALPENEIVSILGSGAMGSLFKKLLGERGIVYSRTADNWLDRYELTGIVINCTSYGTATPDSPFNLLPNVSCVIDLAMGPTNLKKQCEIDDVKYVAGIEFYKPQFQKQFELYTGISLTQEELDKNL